MRLVPASGRWTLAVAAGAVVGLAVAGVSIARRHRASPPIATVTADALEVQVSGCAAVLRGPVCEIAPGAEVRLWLPGVQDGAIKIASGGVELPAKITPWPDGQTARVVVPEGATRLEVHVHRDARDTATIVRLTARPPIPAAIEHARALRKAGHLDDAAAALAAISDAEAGGRSALLSDRARLEYQRGQLDAATADYREAIALHEAEGHPSEAADDASALTYLFFERNRIAEARETLAHEEQLARDYPDGLAGIIHDRGLIAWDTGDLRTALRCAREAEGRFARLGTERRRRASALIVGLRLLELGRYAEAIGIFRALLEASDAAACERGDLLDDVGWAALLALEADAGADLRMDAREPLRQARVLLEEACPDPNRLANVLVNIALGELQHGRLAEARGALDEARGASHDPPVPVVLYWHHLAGRIALASGAPALALSSFAQEGEIAEALGTVYDRLSVAEAQATALVALGRKAQALAALDAADTLVDQASSSIPLGEGMEGFFATRDRAAVRRVDLLVQLGRPDEAMAGARRWRVRVLDGLRATAALAHLGSAQRASWEEAIGRYRALRDAMEEETAKDWELPADRLASARARRAQVAGQASSLLDDALSVLPHARTAIQPTQLGRHVLELLYVPSPSGWLGFARSADGLSVKRIDRIDLRAPAADLATAMLGPFDAEIARAATIRFLPYGSARAVDLHALPWSGRPLLEHAVVEYALGLPDAPAAASGAHVALVVADPAGDLPAARAEADAVRTALQHTGWEVDDLRGAAADGETVRSALGATDLLHYAGHATFGGADGVDSALSLAQGSRLTPSDILALPRVPRVIALFGCDTAHESATGALDALGLTSAFLIAGARIVIATSRAVDDRLARDLAGEFYARLTAAPFPDEGQALRDAVLALRDRSPSADWAAFRVLVP